MSTQPQVGDRIDGRYEITRHIADGGMASVYQATDIRLDRPVAVKIMHMQLAHGDHREQFIERFHREARSAARISNPHIVQIYDTGSYGDVEYLVMEYVHGITLRQEMNQRTTFSVREMLRIVADICEGLAAAHAAGIIHRDMKPENIMLTDRGRVRITDFGLAKATTQATLATTGMLLGTAGYLAPEMIEHNIATAQGDIYSVGIMAWEMLTGQLPFQSENSVTVMFKHVHEDVPLLHTIDTRMPSAVSALIGKLAARSMDVRPADGTMALALVKQCMHELTVDELAFRIGDNTTHFTSMLPIAHAAPGATADTVHIANHSNTDHSNTDRSSVDYSNTDTASTATNAAVSDGVSPDDAATTLIPRTQRVSTDPDQISATATDLQNAHTHTTSLSTYDPNTADSNIPDSQVTELNTEAVHTASLSDTAVQATTPDTAATSAIQANTRSMRKNRNLRIAVIAAACAIAFGIGTAVWWVQLGPGSYWTLPAATDITCAASQHNTTTDNQSSQNKTCTLTGASWNKYKSVLTAANIPFTIQEQYSDTVDQGNIISTDPHTVGDRISKHGGSLTVTVSKGAKEATIPDDILTTGSKSNTKPLEALQQAGFDNVKHDTSADQYSLEAPEGALLSITPQPGTTLKHNAEITVILSKGPQPVSMPDIVGKSWKDAQSALDEARLRSNQTEEYSDSVAEGDVISTSQQPNAQLHWGDTVDVVVSKGPQKVTIPTDLVGKNEKQVTQTLEKLGLKVKTNRILGGLFGTVRDITVDGKSVSGGSEIRLHTTDGSPTEVTLTIV